VTHVALSRNTDDRNFTLSDHEGVFLIVDPESDEPEDSSEHTRDHEPTDESNNWRQFTMRGMSYKLQ